MHSTIERHALTSEEPTFIINPQRKQTVWSGRYSPGVTGSPPMSSCSDVMKIYEACKLDSTESMCKSAASYFRICANGLIDE
ncbi:hypothetical protein FisN_3Lh182 [Fistulifera solaris]|uniref:CHCH domain-containing protein n=1 Tax=Fistulifera solaris TaxID=1519565 RepID=A0A1Z5JNX6_FISSO|nr:hypothetical protein FisN_3Lh182 [Fistulifera solaris]|eukprot:GAX15743.1 hypothetical protein FisN_3Lh182 [Fistulifera solaris]